MFQRLLGYPCCHGIALFVLASQFLWPFIRLWTHYSKGGVDFNCMFDMICFRYGSRTKAVIIQLGSIDRHFQILMYCIYSSGLRKFTITSKLRL